MKGSHWAVTGRYAAPGSRPRHPGPEYFQRHTVVGPPVPSTVEAVLDLLQMSEVFRVKIRMNEVVQNFVNGALVPDAPYPHHMTGGCYVHSGTPDEQFVEWDLSFAFVTRFIEEASP